MASISEIERAKMITSLAASIGNEEANVLATALNLDGQLATRDELRVMEMAIRSEMQDLKDEIKDIRDELKADFRSELGSLRTEFTTEVRRQTRQLFVALLTVVATIFGLIAGLLGLTGKL